MNELDGFKKLRSGGRSVARERMIEELKDRLSSGREWQSWFSRILVASGSFYPEEWREIRELCEGVKV